MQIHARLSRSGDRLAFDFKSLDVVSALFEKDGHATDFGKRIGCILRPQRMELRVHTIAEEVTARVQRGS